MPALNSARTKAAGINCMNSLKTCGLKMMLYADSWKDYLPQVSDGTDSRQPTWSYMLMFDGPKKEQIWKFKGFTEFRCPSAVVGPVATSARYYTYGMNCHLKGGGNYDITHWARRAHIGKKPGAGVPGGESVIDSAACRYDQTGQHLSGLPHLCKYSCSPSAAFRPYQWCDAGRQCTGI